MGRTLRMDMMYEGSSARQIIPEEYREPVYDRTGRRQPTWKEPEPARGGRAGRNGRNAGGRGCSRGAVRSRAVNAGRRKKKKMRRNIVRGLLFYFCLVGVVATLWVIVSFLLGGGRKADAGKQQGQENEAERLFSEERSPEEWKEAGADASLEITPEIRRECQELYFGNEDLLTLVNKEHELSASHQAALRSICMGRLQAADVLYEDLCAMLEAGGDAGYEYWIASAHRDRSYQQGLVDEDVEKYMSKGYSYEAALRKTYEYTMPPGQSEHETGLALDILCSTNTIMDESQAGEPGNRWLAEHCHEYGFILRYPEGKETVTGIQYEPWHFRYVGREAAAYLTKKGWTLEEFYGAL